MKREIKFRAWDKQENEMIFNGATYAVRVLQIPDPRTFEESFMGYASYEMDRFEIMQFTGLKDKNGKEIYEGDIVKYVPHHLKKRKEYISEIIWDDCFCLKLNKTIFVEHKALRNTRDIEVIGNIYENPELLKSVNPLWQN